MRQSLFTVLALVLFGCDSQPNADLCTTGEFWTGGNAESPLMHPGGDCIDCHSRMGEGPTFTIAGTVYTEYDEPDDCNGNAGIEVEITDSEGTVFTTVTNAAGNFSFTASQADPVYPITAIVRSGGMEHAMISPQSTGNCATCHTDSGTQGAPGRVVVP